MKLFKVKCQTNEDCGNIFYAFIIAENEVEAKNIIGQEVWTLGGMVVLSITEEDMKEYPRLLCTCSEHDIG